MELIRVVIADANTLFCEGLKRILAAERDLLIVGKAENDTEVLKVVEQSKPNVLLLDINLPKREAVPVLLELSARNLPTKVLILSLPPERESILDTAKAGAHGYILKRALPATLIEAIRAIHEGEFWVDKRVDCADTFVEFARQTWTYDGQKLENKVIRGLSRRELEILALVGKGFTNMEISKALFISVRTVKVHLGHIFGKLNVKNRTQAAMRLADGHYHELIKDIPRQEDHQSMRLRA